jgi:fibronectin-binding autotransporter adhesin
MKTPIQIGSLAVSAFVAALFLLRGANAAAQSGTWTNNPGGNASGSWTNTGNWNGGVIAAGQDNTADFSTLDLTADSTVTLDGARTIGNLTFGDAVAGNNWNLNTGSAGPLTLAVSSGQPTINTVNGSNSINAVLLSSALPGGITKSGNGTLRLGAANLITNVINNINAGILQVGNNTALGAVTAGAVGTNNVAAGATLFVSAGVQVANQRVFLAGSGAGGTNGALRADAGAGANQQNTRLSFALNSVANPAFVLTGDATIRVDGNPVQAGFLVGAITNNAEGLNYTLTKTGAAELRVDPAVNIAVSNIVIAEGSFGFNGSGNVSGAQVVTVNPGAVAGGRRNTSLNSAASTLMLNGALELCYNTGAANDGVGYDQRVGVLMGNGEVRNSIQKNYTTFRVQSAVTNSVFSGTFVTGTNGPIVLRKSGAGTSLRLTGSSSYHGTNIVEAGSLIIDSAMSPDGGYTVNSGAILAGAGTISVPISLSGALVAGSPTGTLTVSNVMGAGDIYVTNASLAASGPLNTSASGLYFNSVNLSNSTVTVPLQQSGVESSIYASALNIDGTNNTLGFTTAIPALGTFPIITCFSLGGADGFAGLKLQAPAGVGAYLSNNVAFDSTIYVVITNIPALTWEGLPGSTWNIGVGNWKGGASYAETAGVGPFVVFDDTAAGSTAVTLGGLLSPRGVTVNNSSKNYSFAGSGTLGGTGGIVKQGSGTLTVANSGNGFSGGVNINAGTVQVGNGSTTGDLGSGPIVNAGTLALNRSDSFTVSNMVSGNGAITKAGAGTTTVPVSGNSTGAVTVNGGTLLLGPAGSSTFSGDVTGGGAFGVNGAGTIILNGYNNTYSGGTVISNGTLQFGDELGSGALPAAGNIPNNGSLATTLSGTLANNISGVGGVTILSNASLTLSGANTYTGPTRVLGAGSASLNAAAANYPAGSVLMLGSTSSGSDIGSVTFTAGNPVLGGLMAGGNSTSPDAITLSGSGQTLTVNGNVSVGNIPSGASVYLPVTGSGATLTVNTNGGVIQIGLGAPASGGVNPDNVYVDLTAIDNFVASLGTTGAVNLGTLNGDSGPPAGATVVNWFKLAAVSNCVTAGSINVGAGGRQLVPELFLGAGTNIFNVDSFVCGYGGRDGSYVHFDGATGGLRLRGNDGVSRAVFAIGNNPATGTGANITNTVDFTGHPVDLSVSTLIIGNYNNAGVYLNSLSLDMGTVDAQSTALSLIRNNNANAAASGSTLNIGGGTASLGPVSLTASAAYGTLNITNATVTVAGVTSPGSGVATLSVANSTFNLGLTGSGNPLVAPVAVDSLTLDGTVNLGVNSTNWAVGQFPLMSYTGSIGGTGYPALNLVSLPVGVSGYLSNNAAALSVDLVITNAPAVINPNPTNIVFSAVGTTLTLSWPDHLGWILQKQTNNLSVGLSNNWFDVSGSAARTSTNFTINPAEPTVFYRLRLP